MTASDLHLSPAAPPVAGPETTPAAPIDWRALRFADRACCCAARPATVVIMSPAPGRSHPTDLLLCGHHYRASQMALAVAGTAVFTVAGDPVTSADLWKVGAGSNRTA
ncbi:MAG TPA: hypothetical protein VIK57_20415 [Streptosporangiaceae bacterium]